MAIDRAVRPLAVFAALVLAAPAAKVRAEPAAGVRGAVDVYERTKPSIRACIDHVTGDLRDRTAAFAARSTGGASISPALHLVVDPTESLKDGILALREAVSDAVVALPGLRIGVVGAACEHTPPGALAPARDTLTALALAPLGGTKNLLEAVRDAAGDFSVNLTEPRAIVLVTREGGDGEDDVEGTRALLAERGVAFYSIAPEAAFERPWEYDFVDRPVPDLELTQRWTPLPKRRMRGELFFGGDVAFGLVPYLWELRDAPFAQTEFDFGGRGRFPCPSGFGYWALATLSWSTGGRAFVLDFARGGGSAVAQARGAPLFDLGFLNLYAPDLRPRHEVLRALADERKAVVIVRIWEFLADEEAPVVLDHGTLERSGASLVARAMRPVRSGTDFEATYATAKEVARARERALERKRRVEQALGWWGDEAKRPITPSEQVSIDPLRRRAEANFDLLGFQLQKVRFHWGEVVAALDTIDPAVFDGERRVVLRPEPLASGVRALRADLRILGLERAAAFVDATVTGRRVGEKHHGTPWALFVERGVFVTFRPLPIDPRPPPPRPEKPEKPERPSKPPPKPGPPPPPPPKVRPSSGAGGEQTPGGR